MVTPRLPALPKLFNASCFLDSTLHCNCIFYGDPTPTIEWKTMDGKNMSNYMKLTSSSIGPWANSTIHLFEEPRNTMGVLCEGKSQSGLHALSFLMMPPKTGFGSQTFLQGLLQGIEYGAIAAGLLFLLLLPFIVKHIRKKMTKRIAETAESPVTEAPEEPRTSLQPEEPYEEQEQERKVSQFSQTSEKTETQTTTETVATGGTSSTYNSIPFLQ
ncbi:SIGLEC family-like protein 1 [Echinops telfairi]|uniref:SIGLEC family-like protein 1 n=1 Tax=Echinops telfairi TaxID=9371 RepID=A0AC55DB00_ECHTE|nr:SIGLEC family-like protein 1 [Echinops telfairi]